MLSIKNKFNQNLNACIRTDLKKIFCLTTYGFCHPSSSFGSVYDLFICDLFAIYIFAISGKKIIMVIEVIQNHQVGL